MILGDPIFAFEVFWAAKSFLDEIADFFLPIPGSTTIYYKPRETPNQFNSRPVRLPTSSTNTRISRSRRLDQRSARLTRDQRSDCLTRQQLNVAISDGMRSALVHSLPTISSGCANLTPAVSQKSIKGLRRAAWFPQPLCSPPQFFSPTSQTSGLVSLSSLLPHDLHISSCSSRLLSPSSSSGFSPSTL